MNNLSFMDILGIVATVLYLVANVMPRPNPANLTPAWATFWQIVDRLCFLTAWALPGRLKAIGAVSPVYLPASEVVVTVDQTAQNGGEEKSP